MIETQRMTLRPITLSDSQLVFAYRSDAVTNKYQGFIPKTLKEVDDFIARNPKDFNQSDSWFQLVIINKTSNKIIGDIGVHFVGQDNFQCELGCTLSKTFQGKGYATEALQAVIDYLFKVLNKHRIYVSIAPENINSIKLFERLGFRKEAHFKESYFSDGLWTDNLIYAVLNKEWKSL